MVKVKSGYNSVKECESKQFHFAIKVRKRFNTDIHWKVLSIK